VSKRTTAPRRRAYLVEHYRPGSAAEELQRAATRVRSAVQELEREGEPVRFRHATIVASDESLLCVVVASSEVLVRLIYTRASVPFERISAALTEQQ
jgi:broad specificity phosphatase PhoE